MISLFLLACTGGPNILAGDTWLVHDLIPGLEAHAQGEDCHFHVEGSQLVWRDCNRKDLPTTILDDPCCADVYNVGRPSEPDLVEANGWWWVNPHENKHTGEIWFYLDESDPFELRLIDEALGIVVIENVRTVPND